jgi:O-antigen ligase
MTKTTTFLVFVASASLWALSFILPNHYLPWLSFYLEFSTFAALWVLLVHVAFFFTHPVRAPLWIGAICIIAIIPIVQTWAGVIPFVGDGIMAAIYLAAFAVCAIAGFGLATSYRTQLVKGVALTLLISATISALIALKQWIGLQGTGIWLVEVEPGTRANGNLAQANHLATLLSLGIASAAYLYERQQLGRLLTWSLFLLMVLGIGASGSRTPILGATFFLIWWAFRNKCTPHISPVTVLFAAGIFLAVTMLWPWFQSIFFENLQRLEQLSDIGPRKLIWAELWDAALHGPWYGYGWGQVSTAQIDVIQNYPLTQWTQHSHNFFLDLIIWNGLPIGLLIISGISYWLITRAIWCVTPESWFCLLVIGLILVHGMLEYPVEYSYFLLPIAFLAGLADSEQKRTPTFRVSSLVLWFILLIATVLMAVIWNEYRLVEEDYRLMRFETSRIGSLKADQPAPDVYLLTQLREDLRYARTQARPGLTAVELQWMKNVTHRYPYFSSLVRYSLALALNKQKVAATLEMRRLHQLFGDKPYAYAVSTIRELAQSQYPILSGWAEELSVESLSK